VREPKAKAKHARVPTVKSSVVLNPPATAIVKCDVLDVRGQGSFAGEVITHVKKGESVTVLEEITLGHVRPSEPGQWSRIVMPTNATVWVDADFIDAETKAVRVKKVNVRGGPGENYSIVGRLDKGTAVNEIRKKEGWLEIETPTNAFAFVASEYLDKQAAATPAPELAAAPPPGTPPPTAAAPAPPPAPEAPVVVNVPAETAPAPAKPVETAPAAPVAPAPTAASQADQELAALRRATAAEPIMTPTAPAPAAAAAQPESPRTVTREGFVHRAHNIQAPAGYELHDIKTGELIEYLQPAPGQKKFKIFVGTRVRITGSEFLDPSWPRTPVLHVQTVDLMP
jgi:SH3-like domain-containing protein